MTSLTCGTQYEGRVPAAQEAKKRYECEDGGFQTTVRYACRKIECPTVHTVSEPLLFIRLGNYIMFFLHEPP